MLYQSSFAVQVIYNNDDCCDKPSCNKAISASNYPPLKDCPDREELCTLNPIPDGE